MSTEEKITATMVASEEGRMKFLPRVAGNQFLKLEGLIFHFMGKLCGDYKGSMWEFYDLSNGGFYLAPRIEKMNLAWADNYFEGTVSGDAAGIIASLFAINTLANLNACEKMTDAYYALLDFACQHEEAGEILSAID